jgi:asparaginyl-tRNA synthetase
MKTELKGWVTTARFGKKIGFIHISDGTSFGTIQVVVPKEMIEELKGKVGIGTALHVTGEKQESPGPEQEYEIMADAIEIVGGCDASKYPIQKKDTSAEFLRTIPHLRPRVKSYQSIFRVRSILSQKIHSFFNYKGFMWVHTPIITSSDCEGAGEMFHVATEEGDHFGASLDSSTFFRQQAGLTVSGQLEVEGFAQAFSKVYTFGPTFRAEDSHTSRHASEFWMIEPEIAFSTVDDVMDLAEQFVKYITYETLKESRRDIEYLRELHGLSLAELSDVYESDFARVTHEDAQKILMESGVEFEYPVGPRESLQAEHEKYLAEYFGGPVFITHYPREQKAFYMRVAEGDTVEAFDLIFPRIGEVIGGSQREERLDQLIEQIEIRGLPRKDLEWYIDLRRYGSVPHGGFGLGFERMLMWLTGVSNIRDVIPYPRVPGKIY